MPTRGVYGSRAKEGDDADMGTVFVIPRKMGQRSYGVQMVHVQEAT